MKLTEHHPYAFKEDNLFDSTRHVKQFHTTTLANNTKILADLHLQHGGDVGKHLVAVLGGAVQQHALQCVLRTGVDAVVMSTVTLTLTVTMTITVTVAAAITTASSACTATTTTAGMHCRIRLTQLNKESLESSAERHLLLLRHKRHQTTRNTLISLASPSRLVIMHAVRHHVGQVSDHAEGNFRDAHHRDVFLRGQG